jgi:hypothetical protein
MSNVQAGNYAHIRIRRKCPHKAYTELTGGEEVDIPPSARVYVKESGSCRRRACIDWNGRVLFVEDCALKPTPPPPMYSGPER